MLFKNLFTHRGKDEPVASHVVPEPRVEGHLDAVFVLPVIIRLASLPVCERRVDLI